MAETPAEKIMGGLIEARSVAAGETPAARIHINGHAYVSASTHTRAMEALDVAEKALEPFAGVGGITLFGNHEQVPVTHPAKRYHAARDALRTIRATIAAAKGETP